MKQSKFVSRVVAVLGLAGSLLLWGAAAALLTDPRVEAACLGGPVRKADT